MSQSRKILIVEDEPLIAMMLEDFLISLGHEPVGTYDGVDDALEAVAKGGFDLAILDVNVQGKTIWPVATKLTDQGIPFIIATGGHVEPPPAEFRSVPALEKPYTLERVAPVIEAAMAAG